MWYANWYLSGGGGNLAVEEIVISLEAQPDVEVSGAITVEVTTPVVEVVVENDVEVELD